MDTASAANFLTITILYMLSLLIILCVIVIANNIIHKYWKSLRLPSSDKSSKLNDSERVAPYLDPVSGEPYTTKN